MNVKQANEYAAKVRAARQSQCQCAACKQAAMLPAVLSIIAARLKQQGATK